jgi:hypothetical protein
MSRALPIMSDLLLLLPRRAAAMAASPATPAVSAASAVHSTP